MLVFPLIFLIFLPSVFAEQVPNYDNPYSPIFTDKSVYSWTEKVKMTILAPSWNTDRYLIDSIGDDEDHPIEISTREHSLTPYRFTETDVNSGIFTAEIILTGFSHDVDGDGSIDTTPRTIGNGPTSGFLEVDRDSAITISFEFADGVVLTESIPVQWNIGKIQFSEENYLSDNTALIRAIDSDLNLNPESLDHMPIQISSTSDISGIEVDAIETSETSGNPLTSFSINDQIQIVGTISNEQNFKQKFVYLFQVKDENNYVVSISWIQGEISGNQNLDVSQSWIPKETGVYTIETYTWNSLINTAPLSPSLSTSIFVK